MITNLPCEPFTADDAYRRGITKRRLTQAVEQGHLVRLLRNVYLRADIELTVEIRAAAAARVLNPHGVVCDRSAAWIWGVDCFEYRELDCHPPLEIFTLRGNRASRRPQVRGGQRDLDPIDWAMVGGVRVTTPIRTALDLGCVLSRRDALAAMDALARQCGLTAADLIRQLRRYVGRRGVVQLRELAVLVDPRAESPGESWTRLEMHDHGLPRPEVNWWVIVDGLPRYRLDLAYPHARVAIEYDGEEHHSSEADRRADAERRAWLGQRGWTVIVVTKASFSESALAEWIAQVHAALKAAQTPPRRQYARS
jgi:hypothetical protein